MANKRQYEPDKPQGELDLGPYKLEALAKLENPRNRFEYLKPVLLKDMACNENTLRMSQDEIRCRKCGVVWGVDEERPPCDDSKP